MSDIVVRVGQAVVQTQTVTATAASLRVQGGVTGPRGPAGTGTGSYLHHQGLATTVWDIHHNLGFYPQVTTIESAGSQVEGDVHYIDDTELTVTFAAAIGGDAYLS